MNDIEYGNALFEEIEYLKRVKSKTYTLVTGELLYSEDGNGYYRFKNSAFLSLPETGVKYSIKGKEYFGYINYCNRNQIELTIEDYSEFAIDSLVLSIASWRLLDSLRKRYLEIQNNKITKALRLEHQKPLPALDDYNFGSEKAIDMAMNSPVTAIWGPPGTGKTYTLAKIALKKLEQKKSVLIISQSNISVDGAILQILKSEDRKNLKGKVFRYGMCREPGLSEERAFLSWEYTVDRHPDYKLQLERIRTLVQPSTSVEEIKRLNEQRTRIEQFLREREDRALQNASIIATTATKAMLDKRIAKRVWDTVIFDEVSMATVPQIFVAASLANSHLVLLGDFKQLAPIVKNPDSTLLRKDIFEYLHMVSNGKPRKHQWMVMLKEQHRMHPDIAAFVNARIYDGLIDTSKETATTTQSITEKDPIGHGALTLVDYSNYRGVCMSTEFGSRFNVFSAIISVKLAFSSLQQGLSVGIITPYAAQAALINAILKDEGDKADALFCATIHQFQGFEKDCIIFDTVESRPMRETGKMFVDMSNDEDSASRLVNVALTRAKGKIFIVANYSFMKSHMSEISNNTWGLVQYAKQKNCLSDEQLTRLCDFGFAEDKSGITTDKNLCLSHLKAQVAESKSTRFEAWHSYQNELPSASFTLFFKALEETGSKKAELKYYTTEKGANSLPSELGPGIERLVAKLPPEDLLFFGDRVWFGIPFADTSALSEKRCFYFITGENAVEQLRKNCGLDTALKRKKDADAEEKSRDGEFAGYIRSHAKCPVCHSGAELKKAKTGKYYLYCASCKKLIAPYIERYLIEGFIRTDNCCCTMCGTRMSINNSCTYLYCTKEYKDHKGIALSEAIETDFKGYINAEAWKASQKTRAPVVVIKKSNTLKGKKK